jgi:hypothetical protein
MGTADQPTATSPTPSSAGYRSVFAPFEVDGPDDRALRRRRKFVRRGVRVLRAIYGDRPAPLAWWRMLRAMARRIAPGADALTFKKRRYVRRVGRVEDPALRALLAGDPLGEFSLDVASINLLGRRFDAERPTAILQCGAGASTVALAHFARRRRLAGGRCVVVAIEEGARVRDAVLARLDRAGLADVAHVVLAPLDAEGRYRFDAADVARLAGGPFDWVVVEGPIAAHGRPDRVLPDVAALCADGASWFVDDAFRDAQWDLLESWARTPGVEVRGIHALVGKGLATGRVRAR